MLISRLLKAFDWPGRVLKVVVSNETMHQERHLEPSKGLMPTNGKSTALQLLARFFKWFGLRVASGLCAVDRRFCAHEQGAGDLWSGPAGGVLWHGPGTTAFESGAEAYAVQTLREVSGRW